MHAVRRSPTTAVHDLKIVHRNSILTRGRSSSAANTTASMHRHSERPQMAWRVVLSGNRAVLKKLSDSRAHPEWRVEEDQGDFLLQSSHIQEADSFHAVQPLVHSLLEQINGALVAADIRHKPLTADIQQIGPNGKRTLFGRASLTGRVSVWANVTVRRANGTIERESLGDVVWRWVKTGEADAEASRVLRLLAKGNDWVNLYRVYEIIRTDVGGDKRIVQHGWATGKGLELFRRTAQHPQAIGDDARHGVSRGQPPAKPMTPKTARSLVRGLCRRWLAWKARQSA